MAALTPTDAKSSLVNVIEIFGSHDEPIVTQNLPPDKPVNGNISLSTCFAAEKCENFDTNYAEHNNESLGLGEDVLFTVTPKRKNSCNVVLSDDEDYDMHTQEVSVDQLVSDDDVPISQLTRIKKVTRRRLQALGNCESKSQDDKKSPCKPNEVKLKQSIPTTNIDADDESEEDLSYSDGGNMSDFIVDDSDVSNSEDTSKRTCNVVLSESENDGDDDVPISKLMHIQEVNDDDMPISRLLTTKRVPRQRQHPPRKCVSDSQDDKKSSCTQHKVENEHTIPTNVDAAAADETEEGLSYSEEGDLSDFIDDSDVSVCKKSSSKSQDKSNGFADADSSNSQDLEDGNNDSDSQDVSDGEIDYPMIISKIQRKINHKMKWDFEADMLADFGKDSELCMKAVCALNREQTYKEEMWKKEGFCPNKCGFNTYDVGRGSSLAEFLTDGDPQGVLKKTVKELEEYDPKAVEVCRTLATRYSRQLYEIYQNKEDRIFP